MARGSGYKVKVPRSQEHRDKISAARKAAMQKEGFTTLTTCAHCGFVGQELIMKRWHGDNCAYKWTAKSTRLKG
jgi:hypothetical protein